LWQEESRRLFALLQGVFAGNIFDLGAAASAELYDSSGGVRAHSFTRQHLPSFQTLVTLFRVYVRYYITK
jgi:hypothetical protein